MEHADYAIKSATRRLVKAAGGVEAIVAGFGIHRTTISNAQNIGHDITIQAGHAVTMERDIGDPIVTREMAAVQGFELVKREMPPADHFQSFDQLVTKATKELGEAAGEVMGLDHFTCQAHYQKAEREAFEAMEAARHLLEEVRRRNPSLTGPLRNVTTLREAGR